MARLRTNNVFGTTTNNPLLVAGVTLNSAGLANLGVVAAPDVAVLTLDPNRVNGAPEIVHVTAHTGSATSATILRGQEGTAAREHPVGTFWVHAPTAVDLGLGVLGYAQVTADQTGISSEVDLTGLSVAVTVGANRRIRLSAGMSLLQVTSDGVAVGRFREGATALGLYAHTTLVAATRDRIHGATIITPTAGAHTYKLQLSTTAGTVTVDNDATFPAFILVEDIGAA